MEIKPTKDPGHPLELIFESGEMEIMRAAYREYIYSLASVGNTSSISSYEVYIAGWEDDGKRKTITPTRYTSVTEVLQDFADSTDDVIQRIPEETCIPAFQNDDISERHRLGRAALELITSIEKQADSFRPRQSETEFTDESLHDWMRGD